MAGRRITHHDIGMARLYRYKGKRKDTWYTVLKDGTYHNLGHDKKEAKRRLLDLTDGVGSAIPGTVGALLASYLEYLKQLVDQGKRSERTLADYKEHARWLLVPFGNMIIAELTTYHCWHYMHEYKARKDSPVRANREISFLQGAYSYAMNKGWAVVNPCEKAERNEESPRDRYVTDAELSGFLALGLDSIGIAAWLAYLTSKAQGQILTLRKESVSLYGIEFSSRKGGADTFVEWTSELANAVRTAFASSKHSEYVVSRSHGRPYSSGRFKSQWQRRMAVWASLGHKRFTFHDLRAKATTDMSSGGRKASELTGHRDERTVSRVYDRRRVRKAPAVR